MKETKPFYKTSEFWLHNAGQIVLILQETNVVQLMSNKYNWLAPILQAILAAAYMQSRGQAKSGTPLVEDTAASTWDTDAMKNVSIPSDKSAL